MRAIYLHLNKAGLHYTAIAVFSGHPPDVRLYLYFHLQQQNGNVMRRKTVRILFMGALASVVIKTERVIVLLDNGKCRSRAWREKLQFNRQLLNLSSSIVLRCNVFLSSSLDNTV